MSKKIVNKITQAVPKTINEKTYSVDVIMSTEALDRDKEIILADAYAKHLPAFMKQPVIADSHKIGSVLDGLGRFENIEVLSGEGLYSKAHYFVAEEKRETPDKQTVRWAWVLVKNGLGAYSVRFIPHKMVFQDSLSSLEGIVSDEVLRAEPLAVYTEVELVETSQVLVPANSEALVRSIEGYEEKGEAEMLSIAKGVFDKGLLVMPRKSFYIGKGGLDKDSLIIRVTYDGEQEEFDKLTTGLRVEEVKSPEIDEQDLVIKAYPLEEEGETEDDLEDTLKGLEEEEVEVTEADLEELGKSIGWIEEEEVTEKDLEEIGKALQIEEEAEKKKEEEGLEESIRKALDITADFR